MRSLEIIRDYSTQLKGSLRPNRKWKLFLLGYPISLDLYLFSNGLRTS